jgi:release factor glutamine methyltransferase
MESKSWVIRDLIQAAAGFLAKARIESPRLTAEVLLAHQLKTDRVGLYLHFDQPVGAHDVSGFRTLVKRRLGREPLQYITGTREFWSLDFFVDHRVLIPRPETELLVELALDGCRELMRGGISALRVLELGTGSGAVAVSLAHELPTLRILATDTSGGALEVARQNASRHGVSERIDFLKADLFSAIKGACRAFHVVVTNPPYVSTRDLQGLAPELRDHEPRQALDGGETGMDTIRRIIREAPEFVQSGGWVLIEMAPEQTDEALRLLGETGEFCDAVAQKDFTGRLRAVTARRTGQG